MQLISETHSCLHKQDAASKLSFFCSVLPAFIDLFGCFSLHVKRRKEKGWGGGQLTSSLLSPHYVQHNSQIKLCCRKSLTSLHTVKWIWLKLVSSVTFNRATEEGFSAGIVQLIRPSYLCSATTAVPSNFLQWITKPIVSVVLSHFSSFQFTFYNLRPSLSCPPPPKRGSFSILITNDAHWNISLTFSTSCRFFCVWLKLCWSSKFGPCMVDKWHKKFKRNPNPPQRSEQTPDSRTQAGTRGFSQRSHFAGGGFCLH